MSTVDTFQGRDKDAIILSLVRWRDMSKSRILKDWRRINVAITRAKRKLIILGSLNQLETIPIFREMRQYVEEKGLVETIQVEK